MQKDVYYAKARNYPSAREASLFHDNVPVSVYDNLIAAVHGKLPALYDYFELRRRKMKLKDIHHYDTYVPILSELDTRHTWNQAVDAVVAALAPLGDEYCRVLEAGLAGRWCDRYPNQGKRSGAFSSGSYDGWPYILMNYQPDVLDHVFTLAHEAGHSMHSYYSAKHQPYEYYNYTIFVAEVASTFNEQLLSRYLMERAKTDEERAYLINREIDAIRGTIIRQTMFAEFEKITHALVEAGEPLTVELPQDRIRQPARRLLRPRLRHRRRAQARMPADPALLPRVLRLQVRHRPVGGDRAERARRQRRQAGAERLPVVPQRRLLEVAARSARKTPAST